MNPEQAWQSVLGQLQMEMPRASFDTWVRDTRAISIEDGVMRISTRNEYARDWLESRLQSTVQRLLVGILNQSVSVQFVVEAIPDEDLESADEEQQEVAIEAVQWLDYDKVVQPHKQVVVKAYLRRLGMEIGPKAIWLYIGFHQAAWQAHSQGQEAGAALHSREIMRFTGLSFGAFWRCLKHKGIQSQLDGLVQRVDPPHKRKYHRGRDGRPHRTPVRYQVCMTPRLTRADARSVYSRLKILSGDGVSILDALRQLLSIEDVTEVLVPIESIPPSGKWNTVMDIACAAAGDSYTPELDQLAQQLHRRIVNLQGDIHITHYFITQTIHQHKLTPAQAWLITVARDMAFVNSRTGERREVVTFRRGFQEMAELVGSSRYKTVQAWFNPQWTRQRRGGNISCFLTELERPSRDSYADLRTETMPRCYRVLLDEPLDANGTNKADASGSIRPDADGSNSQSRMEALVDATGTNMLDANGSDLNSLKHSLNTKKNNTSTTQHSQRTTGVAPAFWELKTLFQQNNVHPKVRRELLEAKVSVHAFVSWVLFVASPQGRRLSDPLGYALSQLRQDPLQEPRGRFRQFASLPPTELLLLIDSTPTYEYEYSKQINHPLAPDWRQTMGTHNPRLTAARTILFGQGDHQ